MVSNRPGPQPARSVARFAVELPTSFDQGVSAGVALARDGRVFVYGALGDDRVPRLYARPVDQLAPAAIRGTEGALDALSRRLTGSPLSPTVRFRKSLAGGPPVVVCEIPGRGGRSAFHGASTRPSCLAAPRASGACRRRHRRLSSRRIRKRRKTASAGQSLPDGKTVPVRPVDRFTTSSIAVASIGGNDRRTLVEGATYPRLTANNILVFTRVRSLWAVPLNMTARETVGEPTPCWKTSRP